MVAASDATSSTTYPSATRRMGDSRSANGVVPPSPNRMSGSASIFSLVALRGLALIPATCSLRRQVLAPDPASAPGRWHASCRRPTASKLRVVIL